MRPQPAAAAPCPDPQRFVQRRPAVPPTAQLPKHAQEEEGGPGRKWRAAPQWPLATSASAAAVAALSDRHVFALAATADEASKDQEPRIIAVDLDRAPRARNL